MKGFCNAKRAGFRIAFESAEKCQAVDDMVFQGWDWEYGAEANKKLYNLLVLLCNGEAITIVEQNPDNGFEGWRKLCKRFHPVGETYALDKPTQLMHQSRCKAMAELPGAIERWEADIIRCEGRSGEKFQR